MTNEERQQAIEWLKSRPVTMPGAKKMFSLAIEALKQDIIHCKDCNHYWKSKKWCICGRYVKETGFCDMADRKGEADGTD
jgi:hypothetical protein